MAVCLYGGSIPPSVIMYKDQFKKFKKDREYRVTYWTGMYPEEIEHETKVFAKQDLDAIQQIEDSHISLCKYCIFRDGITVRCK